MYWTDQSGGRANAGGVYATPLDRHRRAGSPGARDRPIEIFQWRVDAGTGGEVLLGQVSDPLQPNYGGSVDSLYPYQADVYWSSGSDLWKFPAGGNPRQHWATAANLILGMAVDGTYVYFADGSVIRRLAR